MGCVFVLLCVPIMAKGQNVYLSGRLNETLVVCVCARVYRSVWSKLGFHSIKFDISPYQLCKSHNNFALDLCCHGDNRDSLMHCLDDHKVELACGCVDGHTQSFFQFTLTYHGINHMRHHDK